MIGSLMRVEKWQALGNDYLIVEAGELPWPLTPARIRKICDPHLGIGSDGILLLSPSDDPAYVAALRIFNPDGSEAELYARIDRRVDAMVAAGVIEEVRAAHRAGASATARAALGFDELLGGDVDAMKRRTRNYAKRQLTWMRKLAGVQLVDATGRGADELAAALQ